MCQSQNVGSYEEAGEVSYTEIQKGHEDLCRKEASGLIGYRLSSVVPVEEVCVSATAAGLSNRFAL